MSDTTQTNGAHDYPEGMRPLRAEQLRPKPKLEAAAHKRFADMLENRWVGVARTSDVPTRGNGR